MQHSALTADGAETARRRGCSQQRAAETGMQNDDDVFVTTISWTQMNSVYRRNPASRLSIDSRDSSTLQATSLDQ